MCTYSGKVFWVSQKDHPLLSNAVAMVELHKLVQWGEGLVPDVVLTTAILQHLEVLDMVPITAKQMKWFFFFYSQKKREVVILILRKQLNVFER